MLPSSHKDDRAAAQRQTRRPCARALGGAAPTGYWCREASLSQIHATHRQRPARGCELDVTIRGSLHSVDQRLAGQSTSEAPEFLGRDDDDFLASMDGDVLRAFAANQPNQFTEVRLGVLQASVTGLLDAWQSRRLRRHKWLVVLDSGHKD